MPDPYIILGALLLWALSLVGVGTWQRHDGEVAERTLWQARETKELAGANTKILQLEQAARQSEQDHAARMSAVSADYQRKLSDANKQRDADAAALRAGTLRLRDPSAPGLRACDGSAAPVASAAGGRDGSAPGELSSAASGFLLDLASEADDVARQLEACQRVVIEDRQGQ